MTEPASAYRLRHANRLCSTLTCNPCRDLLPKSPLDLTPMRRRTWRTHRCSSCQLTHPPRWSSHKHLLDQRCCDDRLNPPNTRPLPSAAAAARLAFVRPWAALAIALTTPCAKPSSPHLNVNCLRARTSPRMNRRGARSFTSWRRGTTRFAFIAGLAIAPRSFTNSCMQHKAPPHPHASCPPPVGVVVVTGDPPTGRGQLAAALQTEVTYPLKIQLRNRPPKRVIPSRSIAARWLSAVPGVPSRIPVPAARNASSPRRTSLRTRRSLTSRQVDMTPGVNRDRFVSVCRMHIVRIS